MLKLTNTMVARINEVVRNFLEVQLAEVPTAVSSYLNHDILAVYANGVACPAEQKLMQSQSDHKIWSEYKNQQFNLVRDDLSERIGQLLDTNIKIVNTQLTEEGTRIIHIKVS